MTQPTDQKTHYKMYKKGRFWVFAGITAFTWQLNAINVHADTTTPTTASISQVIPAVANSETTTDALTTKTAKVATEQPTVKTDDATTNQAAAKNDDTATDKVMTKTDDSTTGQVTTKTDNGATNQTTTESSDPSTTDKSAAQNDSAAVADENTNKPDQSSEKDSTVNNNTDSTGAKNTANNESNGTANTDQTANQGTTDTTNQATVDQGQVGDATANHQSDTDNALVGSTDTTLKDVAQTNDDTTKTDTKKSAVVTDTLASAPVKASKAMLAKAAATTDLATGTYGNSAWRIDSAGVLHISGGTFTVTNGKNPWSAYAKDIKEIVFEDTVNGASDSSGLFRDMTNLTTITNANNFKTSKVTSLKSMFANDGALTSLDISQWDTSNVTNMASMFFHVSSLKTLDVSNWNTSNVTNIGAMFDAMTSLTSIDLNKWDTSNVTNMAGMFIADTSLVSVNAGNWNTSKVTSMRSLFSGASALTTIDVSNWDMGNVTDMAFMFANATSLVNLNVSKWDTSSVIDMSSLFSHDRVLANIDVSNWNTSNVADMNHTFYNTKFTSLDVSKWDTNNVTSMVDLFCGNTMLKSLDVSNWKTGSVIDMSYLFYGCESLTTLDVSKWDTSNVTNMAHVFDGAASLANLDTSNWNTSNVTTMEFMFWGSGNLNTLDFSKWDMSNVTTTSSMLVKTNLSKIILGAKNKWSADTGLPDLTANASYTGNWINSTGDTASSSDLFANNVPGTYIRERVKSHSSLETNDSNLVVGPNTTWTVNDGFSGTDYNGNQLTIDDVQVSGDTVDVTTPGVYKVTYTYTDATGKTFTKTATITVTKTTAAVETPDQSIELGDTWNAKEHFSGTDADGSAIDFSKVSVSGDAVDTTKPGTYMVTYSFKDSAGNLITKTIQVVVYGIILNDTNKEISTTSNWDPAANVDLATNQSGDSLTGKDLIITIKDANGNVVANLNKPGTYTVTYTFASRARSAETYSVTATIKVTSKASLDLTTDQANVIEGGNFDAKDYFKSGTDENGDALNFDQVTVSGDKVDTNKPGTYNVIYTYRDASGNETSKTLTVIVSDNQANLDVNDSTVQLGDTWTPEANFNGAVNADGSNVDFKDVTVSGDTVNTKVPGTYDVTYSFTDSTGKVVTKTVKVIVYGIILNETNKEISTTSNWDPATNVQKATDGTGTELSGGDLTIAITDANGNSTANLNKPGTYTVTYSFVTRAGESYTTTATVVVSSKASLNVNDSTLTAGDTWNPKDNFVSGTDENGDALSFDQITVDGTVDTKKPGTYKVTYRYTDASGNHLTKTITVTVTAKDTGNGDGDNNNGDGDTDTGDNNNGDNNNGDGDTDTGDNNNGNGDTNTGDNNNGNGDTNTDDGDGDTITGDNNNGDGDTLNGGNQADSTGKHGTTTTRHNDAATVKPAAAITANVNLAGAANKVAARHHGQLPQTGETATRRAVATSGVVLLAVSGLIFGLGKAVLKRRQN